jgi:hypothetical protein
MSRSQPRRLPPKPLAAAIVAGLLLAGPAAATTRMVTACADTGAGGLRQTIAASASGDTVDMTALTCSKLTLTAGELPVTVGSLTIRGPGSGKLTIDANRHSRVFRHDGTGVLSLSSLTLSNGSYSGFDPQSGGCVFSNGSVSANHIVFTDCSVYASAFPPYFARGGAVFTGGNLALVNSRISNSIASGYLYAKGSGAYVSGDVNIKYSTIDGNDCHASSSAIGGGLFVVGGGQIRNSTISGNLAKIGGGGAFGFSGGVIDIVNSTVSGNTVFGRVGGLSVGAATFSNSTIAFNQDSADYASGVLVRQGGNIDMQSTIIAMNYVSGGADGIDLRSNAFATVTGSHNLIRTATGLVPAHTLRGDPLLAPLADNGGATLTHALQFGSPAIDTGNNTVSVTNDQRGSGFRREAHSAADIGAYEFDDTIFVDGFD